MLKLCVPVHVFKEEYIQISLTVQFFCFYLVPTDPGGGGTHNNGLYGEAPPERGTF